MRYNYPQSTAAARPGRTAVFRTGFSALAAVGRERGNPRSERSEPAALKVQLCEVALFFDFEGTGGSEGDSGNTTAGFVTTDYSFAVEFEVFASGR